jgi:hypothetical protein
MMTSAVLTLETIFGENTLDGVKPSKYEDIGGNFVYSTEKTAKGKASITESGFTTYNTYRTFDTSALPISGVGEKFT